MHTSDEIDPVLVERFARGNGTVFVGAGISLGARLPSWSTLMHPLCTDLGIPTDEKLDYLAIAELYEVKHSRSVLVHYLKEQLGNVKFQLTRTHELIVGLPVQRIYTTNFDTLLEQASQKKQINRNVIYNASHVGFSDTSTLSIVKLHGDLADPDSIVITARDFYNYFAKNPAVADLLKVELQTHTVLFLGYSFSDPNLGMILGNAASQSGANRPLTYTIAFQPQELAVRAMNARGVKVIAIDAKAGTPEADARIEDWLARFRQALINHERRKPHYPSVRQLLVESGAYARNKHTVKREGMTERIKTGLASDFRVIVVKGEPGIGKTQLTVDAALERLQPHGPRFFNEAFEMVVWIRPAMGARSGGHTLSHILRAIANKVDAIVESSRNDNKALSTRINTLLQERRLLVVIEDFDDPSAASALPTYGNGAASTAQQQFHEIRQWLENSGAYANPRSRIIVTSRNAIVAGFVIEMARLSEHDANELLQEHAHVTMLRRYVDAMNESTKRAIVQFSLGNPQAIRLCIGLINGSSSYDPLKTVMATPSAPPGQTIDVVFNTLITRIWQDLERERNVVMAMLVFPTEEWVPARLVLRAAYERTDPGAAQKIFATTVQKCVRYGLLEYDACGNMFSMHRICKETLTRNGHVAAGELDAVRIRLADYLLDYLEREDVVLRPDIPDPYWNALVRDEMTKVDQYWPIIESIMWSASARPRIVRFTLLLAHYMDSRFLNAQRIEFVQQSIAALQGIDERRTCALLHIDALGWTYIEEGSNDLAKSHLAAGRALLTPGDYDLHALAWAWDARICASEGENVHAHNCINAAIACASHCPGKPWIGSRVQMMSGDVHLIDGNAQGAESAYLAAEAHQEKYGGEVDYQTDPRIGFALLAKKPGDHGYADAVHQAERRFIRLAENEHIAIGRLYGEYGLALIAARRDSTREAGRQLVRLLKEIETRRGSSNVLFKLASKSYTDIAEGKRSPGKQQPRPPEASAAAPPQ